jgi:hypothetical protein
MSIEVKKNVHYVLKYVPIGQWVCQRIERKRKKSIFWFAPLNNWLIPNLDFHVNLSLCFQVTVFLVLLTPIYGIIYYSDKD